MPRQPRSTTKPPTDDPEGLLGSPEDPDIKRARDQIEASGSVGGSPVDHQTKAAPVQPTPEPEKPEPTAAEWEKRRKELLATVPAKADRPTTLIGKLAQIMGLIPTVEKRGVNDFHHYNFAKEADLVEAVRPLLAEYGIMFWWTIAERRQSGSIIQGAERPTRTEIRVTFKFIDGADGTSTEPQDLWADGDDPIDKGIYKAMTGAVKYALMKTFMIATGDDPEGDRAADRRNASHEASTRVDVQRGGQRATQQGQRRAQPAPGGRQSEASQPQTRVLSDLLARAGIRKSNDAIVLIERMTGDKIEIPMVDDEPDTAGGLSNYLKGLDGPKIGKLIHDITAFVNETTSADTKTAESERAQPGDGTTFSGSDADTGADQPETPADDDLAAGSAL